MLRNVVLTVSLLMACTGIVLCVFAGQPHAFPLAIWGSVLFILIVAERWRYQRSSGVESEGWQATDEQFVDPESGKLTRVDYNPRNGERRYVVVED